MKLATENLPKLQNFFQGANPQCGDFGKFVPGILLSRKLQQRVSRRYVYGVEFEKVRQNRCCRT